MEYEGVLPENCNSCVKADVCNQREVFIATERSLRKFNTVLPRASGGEDFIEAPVLKNLYQIEVKAICNRYSRGRIL